MLSTFQSQYQLSATYKERERGGGVGWGGGGGKLVQWPINRTGERERTRKFDFTRIVV